MQPPEKKGFFQRFDDLLDEFVTVEDFVKSIKQLTDLIEQGTSVTDSEIAGVQATAQDAQDKITALRAAIVDIERADSSATKEHKKKIVELSSKLQTLETSLAETRASIPDIDLYEMAINTLNIAESLEGDDRFDAKAIKNIEKYIDVNKLDLPKADSFDENAFTSKILQMLPKTPPMNAGGSGATFLKSLRDVDLSGLTKNSKGKYVLGSGGGAGVTDGDKGDITVSGSGTTWTIDNDAVGTDELDLANIDLGDFTNTAGFITDYTVTEGDVTAHEAALSITESQITDLSHDAVALRGVSLDSTVGTPGDGKILVYRSAGSDWVLEDKPAGGSNPAINDITDVTITTVADNEVLAYDNGSSTWINQTASEAGLAAASHTHSASDVTDFDTEVSNNTDVAANTAARHDALTVTDSTEIDFTLTDQDLTASLKSGSIDETKLDTSVNASLDLADSALQSGDNISELINNSGFIAGITGEPLSDLSDVTITSIASGELLKWNGSAWINNTLAEAGIAAASHTHTASEITDFDTEVSNNTDVAANTSARHAALTVTDSSEIDFALTGQDLTATLITGSIDVLKLDAGVQDSLALADSAVQDLSDLGITADATELNYVDGVTSAIQTQLNAKADDSAVVHDTGNETIAGVKTFSSDPIIPDEAYGAGWNGSLEPATKNALYDKIETLGGGTTNNFNNIYVDQSGGTSDTHGALTGSVNGSNTVFTVSQSAYATGTLSVYLNGQLQIQGSSEDWSETTPASGTFTFATAPETGDQITAIYSKVESNSSSYQTVLIDGTPTSDHSAEGPQTDTFNAGTTIAAGEALYMASDGEWALADADASTTMPCTAIALEAGTDGNSLQVALSGSFVRDDTWAWTVGGIVYVSTTAGALTQTAPSATGDQVQAVGVAVTADIIHFIPDLSLIEHA